MGYGLSDTFTSSVEIANTFLTWFAELCKQMSCRLYSSLHPPQAKKILVQTKTFSWEGGNILGATGYRYKKYHSFTIHNIKWLLQHVPWPGWRWKSPIDHVHKRQKLRKFLFFCVHFEQSQITICAADWLLLPVLQIKQYKIHTLFTHVYAIQNDAQKRRHLSVPSKTVTNEDYDVTELGQISG